MSGSYARRLGSEDLLLTVGLVLVLALRPGGALAVPLAFAIGFVMLWGFATLHVPSKVELSPSGVSFSRYGRTHSFAWSDIARVHVRRFPVGDRVLVHISPSRPWRGRYWLGERLVGYREVLTRLSSVSREGGPDPRPRGSPR